MIRTPFAMLAAAALLVMPVYSSAQAEEFTDSQKKELQVIMEKFLLENGDMILKSVNNYQAKIDEQDRKEAEAKAKVYMEKLATLKDLPMVGNPDGDVTMVEYFDYNCGYCRKALEEIQKVLKDDKNLKVIFMDMPILGPQSLEAAKWSLAAQRQGKYFEFHQEVLEHKGPKTPEELEKLAKKVGLDVGRLKKDKADPKIEEALNKNIQTARSMGMSGTPGFIIDGDISPGFIPAERIREIVKEARENKS